MAGPPDPKICTVSGPGEQLWADAADGMTIESKLQSRAHRKGLFIGSLRRLSSRSIPTLDCVLCSFDGTCPNNFSGRFGLEHHLFAVERIDALARLSGRLLDDDEFRKSRDKK